MQYSKNDLAALVSKVEEEFSLLLAKAEESAETPLVKAEESKEEQEAQEEKQDKEQAQDSEEKPAEQQEEKKEDEKQDDEACDYDEEDMEEMHKMYSSMKKGELKAHYGAAKSAMEKCGEMSMAKSETDKEVQLQKSENDLLKSELEEVKKQNEELKKSVDTLVQSMTSFLTKKAPQRKAITEIAVLNKSESQEPKEINLSNAEITKILSEKSKDASLSKSDRMAIDNYYLGNRDVSKISHLLK